MRRVAGSPATDSTSGCSSAPCQRIRSEEDFGSAKRARHQQDEHGHLRAELCENGLKEEGHEEQNAGDRTRAHEPVGVSEPDSREQEGHAESQ
jgi:hypothetical protein